VTLTDLENALATECLIPLGHCAYENGTLILIGPDEPTFWAHFKKSPEFSDGLTDPLDRWSTRVLPPFAKLFDGKAHFPFGGPPYQPFYTWALNTGRFFTSPIGFLVHDTRGLFASFRGAIWVPLNIKAEVGVNPCTACDAPCKTACPVGAFDDGYDVMSCKSHINSDAGADCITQGCRARRACPVYQDNRRPEQAKLHMESFR